MSLRRGTGCEGRATGRKRDDRGDKLSLRKRKPATEAGFFALADRVRQCRREEFAGVGGEKRKTTIASG